MKFFGKQKFPALGSADDDKWAISQGDAGGRPMFVRVNTSAKKYIGHPELSQRLGIAIPLHAPNEHGLPGDAESAQLNDIEDCLFEAIGTGGRVVLVITTGRMREFVSYVASAAQGEKIAAQVLAATNTHEVQHYVESDAKWAAYGQFA